MRRVFTILIAFSLLLSGCDSLTSTDNLTKRELPVFEPWVIPDYFILKEIRTVGLGDSLTQGVGDELKKDGYFGRLKNEMFSWEGVKDVKANNLAKRGLRSDQLLVQLEESYDQSLVKEADIILMTIGGNDVMKVVKKNLFNLEKSPFYEELRQYEIRLDELFGMIRALNGDAVIVIAGLYNPFSIVTEEANEFEDIIEDWNKAIEVRTVLDSKSCFVPVTDLFDSNATMVYHTDFFHPNAKGYDSMTKRFLDKLEECGFEN